MNTGVAPDNGFVSRHTSYPAAAFVIGTVTVDQLMSVSTRVGRTAARADEIA